MSPERTVSTEVSSGVRWDLSPFPAVESPRYDDTNPRAHGRPRPRRFRCRRPVRPWLDALSVNLAGRQDHLYHDKKGGESPWRKHHTSAITRDIWVYDTKAGTHRKITTFAGEDGNTLKILNLESKLARTLLTDKEIFAGGGGHHFLWGPDSKWLLFDYSIPGIAPGEVGIVRADGKSTPTNLTLSGFDDARATWILGGKAMLWFSNRDGLRSVAQGGSAQRDVYAKGKPVLIVVADGAKKTEVVTKLITLAEENRLLYARWVRRNQDEVNRLSNGQFGYIHVPGTCTFAGWEMLQDGLRWGVPGVGVKDSTTGKYLENQQTEPDIRLMNEYHIVITGKDQQLEAAVAPLMKLVK